MKYANKPINSDSQKLRFFVASLSASGYGRRSARRYETGKFDRLGQISYKIQRWYTQGI
ncbi:MAG: hypothetical protein U9Q97_00225 [Acidobacteriota bacterium]|nr:hypothetical protein [Acidobacteriota bacterium]